MQIFICLYSRKNLIFYHLSTILDSTEEKNHLSAGHIPLEIKTVPSGAVAKLSFATALYFLFLSTFIINRKKYHLSRNFYFSSNNFFEQYKKVSDARTRFYWLGITITFRAATGGLLTPRTPVAHLAAASSARLRTILTLERAHTRPYTAWRKRQAALRRRGASLISGRLRGTFPLGLPEFIRQTALPCVRGAHLRLRRSAA